MLGTRTRVSEGPFTGSNVFVTMFLLVPAQSNQIEVSLSRSIPCFLGLFVSNNG